MKAVATRELFAYWNDVRGARAAPERSDIDPGGIRSILSDTFILEMDPRRGFPFRLAGSRVCDLVGHELKDEAFADLWTDPDRRTIVDTAQNVADDAAAAVIGAVGWTDLARRVDLELCILPLRHRGRTHARLLGALAPVETPHWLGACPVTRFEMTSLRMIWPTGRRRAFAPTPDRAPPMTPPLHTLGGGALSAARRIGRFLVLDGGR
ncbi:PAS domain-containing protein [Methylopila jiangsuensis]|uniref:PAS domain-containing protein n=1 Tax=Methylopila jiangsuensis TaxID=586230 RepID=A0A9W6JE23_9HYPH|nr:PAS domain-containing protein [Methylopila jiangsuensis]MDR6286125.1 hypothetical protein [Methylopila jiangsuensis]GLK75885.1 PAS domain-containing protein [Methylopila jiangsuensis]